MRKFLALVFEIAVVFWSLTACESPKKTVFGLQEVSSSSLFFGRDRTGFTDWFSVDGRWAVVYEIDEDTDGDGLLDVRLGQHGEAEGDQLVPLLYDLLSPRKGARLDEVVAREPTRSRLLVRAKEIRLLDSKLSTFRTIPGTDFDLRSDSNPCLAPRQATLDPTGRLFSTLHDKSPRIRLSMAVDRVTTTFTTEAADVWRAQATPFASWVIVEEVQVDSDKDGRVKFPRLRSSCVCRWCRRFAQSVGDYGWSGDRVRRVAIHESGSRVDVGSKVIPVGPAHLYDMDTGRAYDRRGQTRLWPSGCVVAQIPLGDPRVLLRCQKDGRQETVLFDVRLWDFVLTSSPIGAVNSMTLPVRDGARKVWLAVVVPGGEETRLGRLNLADGVVEIGPTVQEVGPTHPSGWVMARGKKTLFVFDLKSGQLIGAPLETDALGELSFRFPDGRWGVVDPARKVYHVHPSKPSEVTVQGCFLRRNPVGRLEKGPRERICPRT
jgi:hypothetical protein